LDDREPSERTLQIVSDTLKRYQQVISFSIDDMNLSKASPALVELFKENPNIRKCILTNNILSKKKLDFVIGELLGDDTGIDCFKLHDGIAFVHPQMLQSLISIDLNCNKLKPTLLKSFTNFNYISPLRNINLSDNLLGDEGLDLVSNAILRGTLPDLLALNLSYCQITNTENLIRALASGQVWLQKLYLSGNKITLDEVSSISNIVIEWLFYYTPSKIGLSSNSINTNNAFNFLTLSQCVDKIDMRDNPIMVISVFDHFPNLIFGAFIGDECNDKLSQDSCSRNSDLDNSFTTSVDINGVIYCDTMDID